LDEHTNWNQHTLGAQLGENVSHHVVVVIDVVELDSFEVSFELAYLGAICIHRVFLDVASFIDLVDDDLGAAVSYEAFDP
jgi:hypothetical protein